MKKKTPGISYRDLLKILAMHSSYHQYSGLRYLEYSKKVERETLLQQLNEEISANTVNAWAKGYLARKHFSEAIQLAKKKLINEGKSLITTASTAKQKSRVGLQLTLTSPSLVQEDPLSPPTNLVETRTAHFDEIHDELKNMDGDKNRILNETDSLKNVFMQLLNDTNTLKRPEEIQEDKAI